MKLIADSGSTKTDWVIVFENKIVRQFQTAGINPFYQLPDEINSFIGQSVIPELKDADITEIHFYGAGYAFNEKKEQLRNSFTHLLSPQKVEINSDLLAAARSTLQHESGIACILGTGSNSCFYNGEKITENVPPLGYILGDEGSGAALGRKLVADFLKKQMPDELSDSFSNTYKIGTKEVLDAVYNQPFPNRFLAKFTPFLAQNIAEAYIYNLVFDCFLEFFSRNVMQYNYKNTATHFVGSIAHHFKDVLEVAAYESGIDVGSIRKSPLEGLVEFHK